MNHALLPNPAKASLPAKYEAAKMALAECHQLDECKEWADKASALASYAKQADDKELENNAMKIRARACRRCGELLKEIEKAHGKNQNISGDSPTNVLTRKKAAEDAGLSKDQAVQAIRVANVPEESFEEQVESEKPPTITKLAEQGTRKMSKLDENLCKGIPAHEQLGMTKEQLQAGTYFGGSVERLAKDTLEYKAADVAKGLMEDEVDPLKASMETILEFFEEIKKHL